MARRAKQKPRITIRRVQRGWAWTFQAPNNRAMAQSDEPYTRLRDAWRGLSRFLGYLGVEAPDVEIVIER